MLGKGFHLCSSTSDIPIFLRHYLCRFQLGAEKVQLKVKLSGATQAVSSHDGHASWISIAQAVFREFGPGCFFP
jgi:hypothetical protein